MRNYEQLIEYIINDEQDKAKALFHNLVVEKSRQIYNDLIAEEMEDEMSEAHGDEADDMMSDIEADHEGMDAEMDHEDDMDDMDDMDHDSYDDDSNYATKDEVMDLESELENLKSQFEQLMADEEHEPEHHDDIDDPDFSAAHEMAHEGIVREYVEKVGAPSNSEGQPVGAKNTSPSKTNSKGIVAGKNDMGGTTKNIARGGTNEDPDGKQYKEPSNEYSKGKGNLPGAGKFENVPGASAGKAFSNAKKPTATEPSGVNKRSTID